MSERLVTVADLFPTVETRIYKNARRLPTGFQLLDRALQDGKQKGFVVPSSIVLGAEPKIGKSTFTQQLVQMHLNMRQSAWALYIDLENGIERFMRRLFTRLSGTTGAELEAGITDTARQERLATAKEWIVTGPGERMIYYNDRALRPHKLLDMVEEIKGRIRGDLLVVIDSLQKLPMDLENRRAGVDEWLRAVEECRDRYDCVVFIISEIRRPDGPLKNHKYKASGTTYKESGDIEYTCDLAMTMRRRGAEQKALVLAVEWNRDGEFTGDVAEYIPTLSGTTFLERAIKPKEERRGKKNTKGDGDGGRNCGLRQGGGEEPDEDPGESGDYPPDR